MAWGLIYMPIVPPSDLNQLDAEVLAVREQLARLEQERADLLMEVRDFELLYHARVGPLQACLEEAQLHIAEYKLRIDLVRFRGRSLAPSQLEAEVKGQLRDQRQRAESIGAEAQAAQIEWASTLHDQPDPTLDLDLKQVYRELAKRVHPDLARDTAERGVRSQRMVQVNDLYAKHQLEALRRILREIDVEHSRLNESAEDRWTRLKHEQAQLIAAIRRVKAEIADLNRSSMLQLKIEYALQKARGCDVLAEVMAQIETQLHTAEEELSRLIVTFREQIESTGLAE
jgi:hypothetical protein